MDMKVLRLSLTKVLKKNVKLVILLFMVILYALCIALFKGMLPNQTSTMVEVQNNSIQSLVVNETILKVIIPLNSSLWQVVDAENGTDYNPDEELIISGTCSDITFQQARQRNETFAKLFAVQTREPHINFSETPYFHMLISSTPDIIFNLSFGLPKTDPHIDNILKEYSNATEIDENLVWVDIFFPQLGKKIDDRTQYVAIDVVEKLSKFNLHKQIFTGIRIKCSLIGFKMLDSFYNVVIKSIFLTEKLLHYSIFTNGNGSSSLDGSVAFLIEKSNIINFRKNQPYLQRLYVSYKINATQNTMYTIYLLYKSNETLTAVRTGFIFLHNAPKTGTYIDWRTPIELDNDFEPIASLYHLMDNGDYAIIFTTLGNNLQAIKLDNTVFTFSMLPYSAFAIPHISSDVLAIASISIIIIAGALPATLMFYLVHLYKKNKMGDKKDTIKKILIIGLAFRLILAPITAHADDTQIFTQLGSLYFGLGILGAQWVSFPGFVYLETAAYFPYALLRAIGFQDFQFLALDVYCMEALFAKLPAILSDVGSFFFILKIADRFIPEKKILLASLYLINPLTIYVSGILGQFDSIFMFTLIASIYYLVANYHLLKATIYSSFAAVLNPVGIATFIPLLLNIILKENWKALIRNLLLAISIFGAAMAPFFFETKSPLILASYQRVISGIPGEPYYGKQFYFYAYGTGITSSVGYGLTFRFMLELLGFSLGPIFYPLAAALLFFTFIGFFIYKTYKNRATKTHRLIYMGTFMLVVTSLFQLMFPLIFEQFVSWIVGLLLISYILTQDKKYIVLFGVISIATGFVYVCTWRDYLLLASGVKTTPFENAVLATWISALIGTTYSIILLLIIIITLRMWTQEVP